MARKGIEVSIAMAEAVGQCDVDAIAAYPITPQTHVVEHLSELVADGVLDAEFIPVESEHSAMSACCGTAAVGARTFTATASQGLALMHEILFIASNMRLPIVMAVANRSLSGPISIWNDHSDVMSERDTGWIQIFVENGQEAYDHTIAAFRIAEDPRVSLPVAVNFDGFILSHMIEPIEMEDSDRVKAFLPRQKPLMKLDVDHPVSMGPVGMPEVYTEAKYVHEKVLRDSLKVIEEHWAAFEKEFGRGYNVVETYKADDAEIVLVTMGALSETAMTCVDGLREAGQKVGLVKPRLFRPWPAEALTEQLKGRKAIGVVDRAISYGGPGGPVASEIKAMLYSAGAQVPLIEFVAGLGGRDVAPHHFEDMFARTAKVAAGEPVPPWSLIGLRE